MIYFEKYEGTGNDFIILNGINISFYDKKTLVRRMCDRHFGIGADGLMIVLGSSICDVKMEFYNADGTIAPMCGNGIRCFAKYVYDIEIVSKKAFTIETLAGVMQVSIDEENISVNMGTPNYEINPLDVHTSELEMINQRLEIEDVSFNYTVLTMGTLHCVIFVNDLEHFNVEYYGRLIESHPSFPRKINVNFTEIINENTIKVRTYERGVGPTLSCGTGSAASALISRKLKGLNQKVHVEVLGGRLVIEEKQDGVYLSGPARLIARGYYYDE